MNTTTTKPTTAAQQAIHDLEISGVAYFNGTRYAIKPNGFGSYDVETTADGFRTFNGLSLETIKAALARAAVMITAEEAATAPQITEPETATDTKPETTTGTKPETATGTKPETATGTAEQQALRAQLEQLAAESIGGTGNYYRHNLPGILITDGARKLAEMCEAFWFIDVIASWQLEPAKIPDPDFQCWKIEMTGENQCNIICSDGNSDRRTMQEVAFTDFPLPEGAELLAIPTADKNGRRILVIMHPREY